MLDKILPKKLESFNINIIYFIYILYIIKHIPNLTNKLIFKFIIKIIYYFINIIGNYIKILTITF
jgi:hypothetical protein